MDMNLKPVTYNKTILQEDGITHIVDTSKDYTAYELTITERYCREDKREVVECVIKDLDRLKEKLIEILAQDKRKNEEREVR